MKILPYIFNGVATFTTGLILFSVGIGVESWQYWVVFAIELGLVVNNLFIGSGGTR